MISKHVLPLLVKQVTMELQAAHDYKGMEVYFMQKGLPGFAHWFHKQSAEEIEHANKIMNFLFAVNEKVAIGALEAATTDFPNDIDVIAAALIQEKKVTRAIFEIAEAAEANKDFATRSFIEYFVKEQVEEEDAVRSVLDKMKLIGENGAGIYMLDKELSER